jgi:hypothetical protein
MDGDRISNVRLAVLGLGERTHKLLDRIPEHGSQRPFLTLVVTLEVGSREVVYAWLQCSKTPR